MGLFSGVGEGYARRTQATGVNQDEEAYTLAVGQIGEIVGRLHEAGEEEVLPPVFAPDVAKGRVQFIHRTKHARGNG